MHLVNPHHLPLAIIVCEPEYFEKIAKSNCCFLSLAKESYFFKLQNYIFTDL